MSGRQDVGPATIPILLDELIGSFDTPGEAEIQAFDLLEELSRIEGESSIRITEDLLRLALKSMNEGRRIDALGELKQARALWPAVYGG